MKKLVKSSIFLAILSGIGFFSFRMWGKIKELKSKYETCVFFKAKKLKFDGQEFEGGSYAVMFSGLEMDFNGATLTEDVVVLDLYGAYCGISIKVPDEWNVILDGEAIRSGVSDTTNCNEEELDKPVLKIKYNIQYTGLEVRNE